MKRLTMFKKAAKLHGKRDWEGETVGCQDQRSDIADKAGMIKMKLV